MTHQTVYDTEIFLALALREEQTVCTGAQHSMFMCNFRHRQTQTDCSASCESSRKEECVSRPERPVLLTLRYVRVVRSPERRHLR